MHHLGLLFEEKAGQNCIYIFSLFDKQKNQEKRRRN
jgi:hypothetical protein